MELLHLSDLFYEEAGWSAALDKQRLRKRAREFQQTLCDQVWGNFQSSEGQLEAERALYRLAAGPHAV